MDEDEDEEDEDTEEEEEDKGLIAKSNELRCLFALLLLSIAVKAECLNIPSSLITFCHCFLCAVVGQNKYLKAKFGAVDDEMADDDNDQDEENKRVTWGSRKNAYMNADNVDFEVTSVFSCL